MAQSYTPHDGKHYFPVWNRYAIRKYYTASSGEMSTTPQDVLKKARVDGRTANTHPRKSRAW